LTESHPASTGIAVKKTVVINAVGLTPALIGQFTPRLRAFRDQGRLASVGSVLPAVTTSVQSTYLTGTWPADHGIVGNGWYFRDECEVKFWRQSDHLVNRPRLWETAKQIDPNFTCANMFWWYAMYSKADYTVTPRPMYPADGRKLPDIWTNPPALRDQLQNELGQFPLFSFWGPATSIKATQWIADAARKVDEKFNPTLSLIYLPHLDYCLQRCGPDPQASSKDLEELDMVCGQLIDHFAARDSRIVILSEYGITAVNQPVHLNRVLRGHGLLTIREELGHELLDAGASKAFAVADHQVAHIQINDPSVHERVREVVTKTPGVETVLDDAGKHEHHINHPRAGELVAIADKHSWFTYYYWQDEARAPDFARTVDIHRKPGYDPAELFLDPKLPLAKAKIALTLLRKKLGFRYLMNVIPLDASIVRGSHGRLAPNRNEGPLLISNTPRLVTSDDVSPIDVHETLIRHIVDA
jgi:predicted AlkP superfamily pyrophosphatase or phosphodiesterase